MKIFDKAKDKNVAAITITAADSGYVYAGTENEVAEDDYFDLFIHGVVLVAGDEGSETYARAIGFDGEDFVWAEIGD